MKAKHDALVEALTGMFDAHHGELAELELDQIAFLDKRIGQLEASIRDTLAPIPAAQGVDADGTTGPAAGTARTRPVLPAAVRLAEIPGVSESWPRDHRRDRPGHDPVPDRCAPGVLGRAMPGRQPVRPPQPAAARKDTATPTCAAASARPPSDPPVPAPSSAERYRRVARRRGKAKAQVAVARSILTIIWHLLDDRAARYTDLGPDYVACRTDRDKKIRNHVRRLQAMGLQVTLTPTA